MMHYAFYFSLGARLVGLGGKIIDRAAPSRMALIPSDEENTSESGSGSVQVQATDLYPLDMYDGGSQFQPSSLRLGGSSLVLEEDACNQKRLAFVFLMFSYTIQYYSKCLQKL